MPQVKCLNCGRIEGESGWFKSAQSIGKCRLCRKEEMDAEKEKELALKDRDMTFKEHKLDKELEHRRWELNEKQKIDDKKAELAHQKEMQKINTSAEIKKEQIKSVASAVTKVESERMKLIQKAENNRAKIVQQMLQNGQEVSAEDVRSLLLPVTALKLDSLSESLMDRLMIKETEETHSESDSNS
uniref:Uncharacterized protein n=1 Tax=Amphimedon queenslandica TaxID=400682 RepID=A0A1X7TQG3_AMPQE